MVTCGKNKKYRNIRVGFTMCQPPTPENEIRNENMPMKEQIQLRANKLLLEIKPQLSENLERKIHIGSNEKPLDCGFRDDKRAVAFFSKH